jgi:rubrerythrin
MKYAHLRTPVDILQAALEKEAGARDFYAELAHRCRVDFVKDLLLRLHNEEEKHVDLIRKMLARLGTGHPPL